jgi:hypothetical protein
MPFRAALFAAVMLAVSLAAPAHARIRTLVSHEPVPRAMMEQPAAEGPVAPIQLTTRTGCSCQGQSETCACSGRSIEQCCCNGRAPDPRPVAAPRTRPKRRSARR